MRRFPFDALFAGGYCSVLLLVMYLALGFVFISPFFSVQDSRPVFDGSLSLSPSLS